MDLFITLLSMGESGLKELLSSRRSNFEHLKESLNTIASKYGERVLETKMNKISIGVTLTNLPHPDPTFFGSYLFSRRVSGIRVIAPSKEKEIAGGLKFTNYGSSCCDYSSLPYFTCAAAIGQTKNEIDQFLSRLEDAFKHFYNKPTGDEQPKEQEEKKEEATDI